MRGKLITLCGMDACGKATQSKILANQLDLMRIEFPTYDTWETAPMGSIIAGHLHGHWRSEPVDRETKVGPLDAVVFQACMAVNKYELAPVIAQSLDSGVSVITDRYWPSAYAFGKADGLDGEWLIRIHSMLPHSDLMVLLDIDHDLSVARRPDRRDRYERLGKDFYSTVRSNYHELWAMGAAGVLPGTWVVVDGRQDVGSVTADILTHISGA